MPEVLPHRRAKPAGRKSKVLKDVDLDDEEIDQIVAFINSLTSTEVWRATPLPCAAGGPPCRTARTAPRACDNPPRSSPGFDGCARGPAP